MPNFQYIALDAALQPVRGTLTASSVAEAVRQLEAQGLDIQSLEVVSDHRLGEVRTTPSSEAIDVAEAISVEQATLESHLSTVLSRGRTILAALQAYAAELPARQRRSLQGVIEVLDRGDVAEAVTALRKMPEYWLPLLSSATNTGDPGRLLRDFLEQSQRSLELRRQRWATLAYPLLVAGVASIVLVALSVLVIPVFRTMFQEFDLKLAWLTQIVITGAEWIASGRIVWQLGALVLVAFTLAFATKLLPKSLQEWCGDRWGSLLGRSSASAYLAHSTAELLEAGLGVPSALRIAGFTTRSPRLQRGAWRLATQLAAHGGRVPTNAWPLSHTFVVALDASVPDASRIRLLRELSVCHAEQTRARWSWSRGMLEPLLIVVIGCIVGLTVLALFMPLFSLIEALA